MPARRDSDARAMATTPCALFPAWPPCDYGPAPPATVVDQELAWPGAWVGVETVVWLARSMGPGPIRCPYPRKRSEQHQNATQEGDR